METLPPRKGKLTSERIVRLPKETPAPPPTPHPGASVSAVWLVLAAAVVVAFWIIANRPSPVVTLDEYSRLQEGMTYEQAVTIIGAQGVEQASSTTAGVPGYLPTLRTRMYGWVNRDGSNMNATFQNGTMIGKAQLGLR